MNNVFPGAVLHPTTYYGYPYVGSSRRMKPTILGVIHTTETYSVPYPSSTKSWTFSVERNGTVHQFMDPVIAAPWTNGDLKSPDLSNPIVANMAAQSGWRNPNEFCFVTIENVNRIADGQRLTQAQLDANHAILSWASRLSGIPLDRTHVIGHYQINGETRVNCPTVPTDRARVFGGIVAASLPDTATGEVMDITAISPSIATVASEANIRSGPTLSSSILYTVPADKTSAAIFVGKVQGDEFPAGSGKRTWYVYILNQIRFVHESQLSNWRTMVDPVTIKPSDCAVEVETAVTPLKSQIADLTATVNSQTGVIAGLKTDLAEAETEAANALSRAEAAEELVVPAQALKDALRTFMA